MEIMLKNRPHVAGVTRTGILLGLALYGLAAPAVEVRTTAQEATDPKYVVLHQGGKTQIGGLCIDIMRAIERVEPGITFVGDQSWQPVSRTVASVGVGQIDAACGFLRTAEREASVDYLDAPLFSVDYFLVVRADDKVSVKNWSDVRKLGARGVVLVNHGFGEIAQLEKLGGLAIDDGAFDTKTNLAKLLEGRGRFFIHRLPGLKEEIRRDGLQDKVRLLPTPMYRDYFYMIVSKKLATEIREKMNKAILQIRGSGEMTALLKKWDAGEEATP